MDGRTDGRIGLDPAEKPSPLRAPAVLKSKKRMTKAYFVIGMSIYILLFEKKSKKTQGNGRFCHKDVNL